MAERDEVCRGCGKRLYGAGRLKRTHWEMTMGTRATRPILAALAASSVLLGGGAAADDAGERAFANELRILPAFTAQLEHTVTVAEKTSSEVARLEMDPRRAGFRLRYRTLPIEIWRAGMKVVTMPSGAGKPPRTRAESAGKLAALLFMVGSGAMPREMDVTLAQRQDPRRLRADAARPSEPDRADPVRVRPCRVYVGRLRVRTSPERAAPHRAERARVCTRRSTAEVESIPMPARRRPSCPP